MNKNFMTLKKQIFLFLTILLFAIMSCEQEFVVVQEKPDDIIILDTIFSIDTNVNTTTTDTFFKWQSSKTADAVDDATLVETLLSDLRFIPDGRSNIIATYAWVNRSDSEISNDARCLIKFNELSLLEENIVIDSAFLTLFVLQTNTPFTGPFGANQVHVHRALENWGENTVNWNAQPTFSSDYVETSVILSTDDSLVINITDHVSKMIEINNYGLLLKNWNEDAPESSARFYSSEAEEEILRPYLTMYYHEE